MNFTNRQMNESINNRKIDRIDGNNCYVNLPDGKVVTFSLECIYNKDVNGKLKLGDRVSFSIPGMLKNINPNTIIVGFNVVKLLPPTSSASANNIRVPVPNTGQFKNLQPLTSSGTTPKPMNVNSSTSFPPPHPIDSNKRKFAQYAEQNVENGEKLELDLQNKRLKNVLDNQKIILGNQKQILSMISELHGFVFQNASKKQPPTSTSTSTSTSTPTSTSTTTSSSSSQKPTDKEFSNEEIDSVLKNLIEQKINFLAIDFDQTITNTHTGGRWEGKTEDLAKRLRPVFLKLIPRAIDLDFYVAVVTFSPQTKLIADVLKIAFPKHIGRICIRGSDGTWRYNGSGSRNGKQAHMSSAVEELRRRFDADITRDTTLLIDDDSNNIEIAQKVGMLAVRLDPQIPNELVSNLGKVKKQT